MDFNKMGEKQLLDANLFGLLSQRRFLGSVLGVVLAKKAPKYTIM